MDPPTQKKPKLSFGVDQLIGRRPPLRDSQRVNIGGPPAPSASGNSNAAQPATAPISNFCWPFPAFSPFSMPSSASSSSSPMAIPSVFFTPPTPPHHASWRPPLPQAVSTSEYPFPAPSTSGHPFPAPSVSGSSFPVSASPASGHPFPTPTASGSALAVLPPPPALLSPAAAFVAAAFFRQLQQQHHHRQQFINNNTSTPLNTNNLPIHWLPQGMPRVTDRNNAAGNGRMVLNIVEDGGGSAGTSTGPSSSSSHSTDTDHSHGGHGPALTNDTPATSRGAAAVAMRRKRKAPPGDDNEDDEGNKAECEICQKKFHRPWLLNGHMRTHTGDKPYQCSWPHCGRRFADRSNWRAHERTHGDEKPFSCPRCRKAFKLKSYLTKHVKSCGKIE